MPEKYVMTQNTEAKWDKLNIAWKIKLWNSFFIEKIVQFTSVEAVFIWVVGVQIVELFLQVVVFYRTFSNVCDRLELILHSFADVDEYETPVQC